MNVSDISETCHWGLG